jgi:hypothetical protein
MRRVLAAGALAVAALAFPVSAHAAPAVGPFGGQCDGVVDFGCREGPCPELDCGLVPPCFVWVAATGCLL